MYSYTALIKYFLKYFIASIMQGISLSPQHPLILAYYCISMIEPSEKFVKVGIVHPIIHHLKAMELFMTLTAVSSTYTHYVIIIRMYMTNNYTNK